MSKYLTSYEGFLYGCDYNPEQWLDYPEVLADDIKYMKKAHMNVMAMGMFSWSFLEPEENKYCFEYLDKIIDDLGNNGIKIILSTPSGARPRWLAEKYPEVLRVNKNMQRNIYGIRHNHCYTSPVYREKTAKINRLLSKRYSGNPNVILWHISNEFGGECHCDLCQVAFKNWLKKKYHYSLKELNDAWWSGFWSHTVTDWNQIHSPVSIGESDEVLTGLYLDWMEFVTYQTTDFMQSEIEAIRSVSDNIPVTSNFMGPYPVLDYQYMKHFLDVMSWDCYPTWHSDRGDVFEGYTIGFAHDFTRSLKRKPFLLMESTPSLTNWLDYNKLKRTGMDRLSSLQAVAHGSDSVQYFQWRKGRGGCEKFHGAVIDHDGKASGRVFEYVTELGITLEKIKEIAGTQTKSDVAIVYETKNRWAIDNAMGFQNLNKKYKRTCINHYKEFWKKGINVDVIGTDSDFSPYKLLILPMLYSVTQEQIDRISSFVENGGIVVATYMTGYVNENDLAYLGGFPGDKLKDVFGLVANEIDSLYENDKNSVRMNGKSFDVIDYCELVTPVTAEILAVYEKDFYSGKGAVFKNNYKKGTAYYIACRDTGELLDAFYEDVLNKVKIERFELPVGVTVHTRESESTKYIFAENYTAYEQNINIGYSLYEIESGETIDGNIKLGPYGIKVFRRI